MTAAGLITMIVALILSIGGAAARENEALEPLTGRVFHVSAEGDIGYVAVTAGLEIVDLSRSGNARVLAVVPLPQSATHTLVRGRVALVAQGPAGVYAVDVGDPSTPALISSFDTPGSAMMLDDAGDLVAVADGSMGIALFDVRDPRRPVRLDSPPWPGGYCRGLGFRGSRLYACAGRRGVAVLAPDEEGRWRLVGSCATAGDARDIAFGGGRAAVADGKSGLTILDLTDADRPKTLATTPVSDFVHGVAVQGAFVYAAEGVDGIGVYRLGGAAAVEPVSRVDTLGGYANRVTVHGRRLLVANDAKGFLQFDITDTGGPRGAE